MSIFNATLLADMLAYPGEVFAVLELSLPDGTKKWASMDISSISGGHYSARVEKWGVIPRVISDSSNSLESPETSVTIDDTPLTFVSQVEGVNANSVRGSSACIKVGTLRTAYSNWEPIFTGVLKRWKMVRPNKWELRLAHNDTALHRDVPRKVISSADFVAAPAESTGKPWPLLFGVHDSTALGVDGMIACLHVDSVRAWWMVCAGRAKAVYRVYREQGDTTELMSSSSYAVTARRINGRYCTLIEFSDDPCRDADGKTVDTVIRADVDGIETAGDTTGSVITNPAGVLRKFLAQFTWQDYSGGGWLSESGAPIDTDSFDAMEDYFDQFGHVCAEYITERKTAKQFLDAWCKTYQCVAYWTAEGKIAIGLDKHFMSDIYTVDSHIRADLHDMGGIAYSRDDNGLTATIKMEWLRCAADNDYLNTLEVSDPDVDEAYTDTTLSMEWSPASVA
jgi:hypothetical protein